MAERTYLTTSFKEKDHVKALGARWDREAGQWYVPIGLDLAQFATWLPAGAAVTELDAPSSSGELATQVKGIPLSRLLAGVATAVARAFSEGIWTTAEVLKASVSKGHYYLELSERSETGEVLAQARAVIWARTAQSLLSEFRRATGADLDAGIKVLLRAKPVFKSQYGFSLEVDGIDPSYTLGDLEAKKRDIRERLKREGLFDRNRRLPAPWDYNAVLVVAPERAAGLGDFANEAERLEMHGVCQFSYANSRFQGEGAAGEIVQAIQTALRSWSEPTLPDAVVIIRGGGSVNDLAWLTDYGLARFICECPVPVLTGIGHERDSTVLDEVAHLSFDTPSKVAAGIEQQVLRRAREARANFDAVVRVAATTTDRIKARVESFEREVKSNAASTIAQAKSQCSELTAELRLESVQNVHGAYRQIGDVLSDVRSGTLQSLSHAKQLAPASMETVKAEAFGALRSARARLQTVLPSMLDRARLDVRRARSGLDLSFDAVIERSHQTVRTAAASSEGLFREVAGQGPEKTLGRGFAMVRTHDGKTVTTAHRAVATQVIEVSFHDGSVTAHVLHNKTGGSNEPLIKGNADGTQDLS